MNLFSDAALTGLEESIRPAEAQQEAEVELGLPANTELALGANYWDEQYLDKDFDGGRIGFELKNTGLDFLKLEIEGHYGSAIRYRDASEAPEGQIEGSAELRAFGRFALEVGVGLNQLGQEGEEQDRLLIYRARAVVAFSRALNLRLIVQGRDSTLFGTAGALQESSSRLDLSALLTLIPYPGTSIYLGYAERLLWGSDLELQENAREIFLKATLLVRL